jgi:hypothetical protein
LINPTWAVVLYVRWVFFVASLSACRQFAVLVGWETLFFWVGREVDALGVFACGFVVTVFARFSVN